MKEVITQEPSHSLVSINDIDDLTIFGLKREPTGKYYLVFPCRNSAPFVLGNRSRVLDPALYNIKESIQQWKESGLRVFQFGSTKEAFRWFNEQTEGVRYPND